MKRGFSLIGLLVVVSLLAMAEGLLLSSWWDRSTRARDDRRKGDLAAIKTAFDRWWPDHTCYPALSSLSVCGSGSLSPYLATVPCDPATQQPYRYLALDGDVCKGYRILTKLENTKDPEIARLGCNGPVACGFGKGENYGVSAATDVVAPGVVR